MGSNTQQLGVVRRMIGQVKMSRHNYLATNTHRVKS
jgi:hypothetical protein